MSSSLISIADKYRKRIGQKGGVVLFYNGAPYAWKNCVRDPQCERPGAVAVDSDAGQWIAAGGDNYNGATHWQQAG